MARSKKTTTVRTTKAKKSKPDMRVAFDFKITTPDGHAYGISHDVPISSKDLKKTLKKEKIAKLLREAADYVEQFGSLDDVVKACL